MVQFAPVGSVATSRLLERRHLLGDYRLLLAHDVVSSPATYERFYRKYWKAVEEDKRTIGKDMPLIIMDNSVVELGSSVNSSQILAAVNTAYADIVVLADKMLDPHATFAMSLAMQKGIKLHGKPDHLGYMGVVQGRTVEECVKCAANLSTIDDIRMFGIPKVLARDEAVGTRVVVTARVAREFGLPIHLLGFSGNPQDDLEASQVDGVIGIDSSLPLRMAYDGFVLNRELQNAMRRKSNDFLQDYYLKPQHILNLKHVREFFGCQTDVLDAHTEAALSEYGEISPLTSPS